MKRQWDKSEIEKLIETKETRLKLYRHKIKVGTGYIYLISNDSNPITTTSYLGNILQPYGGQHSYYNNYLYFNFTTHAGGIYITDTSSGKTHTYIFARFLRSTDGNISISTTELSASSFTDEITEI